MCWRVRWSLSHLWFTYYTFVMYRIKCIFNRSGDDHFFREIVQGAGSGGSIIWARGSNFWYLIRQPESRLVLSVFKPCHKNQSLTMEMLLLHGENKFYEPLFPGYSYWEEPSTSLYGEGRLLGIKVTMTRSLNALRPLGTMVLDAFIQGFANYSRHLRNVSFLWTHVLSAKEVF